MEGSCEGCASYGQTCRGDKSISNTSCPCQTCLIKTMCIRPCEVFEEFEDFLHKHELIARPARIRRALHDL